MSERVTQSVTTLIVEQPRLNRDCYKGLPVVQYLLKFALTFVQMKLVRVAGFKPVGVVRRSGSIPLSGREIFTGFLVRTKEMFPKVLK